MRNFAIFLSMVIAAPAMAHEAGLPHAHTSETTWVPFTLLVGVVAVASLLVLRKAKNKS